MGSIRTHLIFTNGDDVVHTAKIKDSHYNLEDYESMDLNEVERQIIHEKRIADEENAEQEWRKDREG